MNSVQGFSIDFFNYQYPATRSNIFDYNDVKLWQVLLTGKCRQGWSKLPKFVVIWGGIFLKQPGLCAIDLHMLYLVTSMHQWTL